MRLIVLGLIFIGLTLNGWAEEYRTFTDKDGREIKAKILKVDPRSGKVTVERDNRRKVTVPANIFSEADQTYIKEWLSASQFLMNSKFKIEIDSDKEKVSDELSTVVYTISLHNRSNLSIPAVKVEYCMCINVSGFGGKSDSKATVTGSLGFGAMHQGSEKEMKTKEGKLKTTQASYTYEDSEDYGYTTVTVTKTGYKKSTEGKIAGIMLKVYGPMVGGEQVVRDYSYPKDIGKKFQWPRGGF